MRLLTAILVSVIGVLIACAIVAVFFTIDEPPLVDDGQSDSLSGYGGGNSP